MNVATNAKPATTCAMVARTKLRSVATFTTSRYLDDRGSRMTWRGTAMMVVRPNTAAANTSQAFSSMSLCPNEFMIVMLQRIPVDLIHLAVMRGLDPRIHHLRKIYAKRMDPRVKPAGDGRGWASADSNRPGAAVGADPGHVESLSGVMAGLVPAIHALLC